MSAADDAKVFDVRTIERKLRRGLVSRKEYEKYIKSLPDRAPNVIQVPVAAVAAAGADDEDDLDAAAD